MQHMASPALNVVILIRGIAESQPTIISVIIAWIGQAMANGINLYIFFRWVPPVAGLSC